MAIQSSINALIASVLGASKLKQVGEKPKVSQPTATELQPTATALATQKDVKQADIVAKQDVKVQSGVQNTQMGRSGFQLQFDPSMYGNYAMFSMATNGKARFDQKQKFNRLKSATGGKKIRSYK